jgi:two-component system chemotaxis sensor kinase CheA
VHSSRVFRLRGKLLPLVELRQILRLPERSADAALHILVLQADGREFGLVVDSVRDTEEIVVKPLGRHLKSVTCFAGATIMGDGRVALILDAVAIAQRAHVLTEAHQDGRRNLKQQSGPDARDKRVALLLFRIGEQGLGAIPLARVQRLEEIHASSIEYSGGEEVVQYRNEILPLMRLSRVLNARGHEAAGVDMMQVIVHRGDNGQIGLVVDHIIDIVDEELTTFQRQGVSRAIVGSAVIQGRVTDLIDLDHVVAMSQGILCAVPEQLAPAPGAANPERPHG